MYKINSVSKALSIMDMILANSGEMSLKAISQSLKLNKSTTSHLVSTLVMHGYIKQRQKYGKYSVGARFLDISHKFKSSVERRGDTIGYILELSRLINETVHILVWYGSNVLFSKAFDYSDESIKIIPYEWSKIPLHCTGYGKLILACMSNEDIEKYFQNAPIKKLTPNTITDVRQIKNHLKVVRKQNIAFVFEECFEGVNGIAAAIKNGEGETVGSLSVEGLSSRLTRDVMLSMTPTIKDCALKISRELGYLSLP